MDLAIYLKDFHCPNFLMISMVLFLNETPLSIVKMQCAFLLRLYLWDKNYNVKYCLYILISVLIMIYKTFTYTILIIAIFLVSLVTVTYI